MCRQLISLFPLAMAQGKDESVVSKRKLQELAADVCPRQVLDEDTEEVGVTRSVL